MAVRILMLEDVASDADLIERELRKAQLDFTARRVVSREEFVRELREFHPDVVISDHNLPQFGGEVALRLTKAAAPAVPFILVTGSLNEETAVEYMKAGASDYVLKDRLARLGPAVLGALERKRLEEQLRQAQKMEAVGQLAGGVAHDFNNIITAMMGYSDLLLEELTADSPLREDVAEIRKAAERAAALTRQLLAFSRRQILAPQVLDLNDLVAEMDKLLRRLLGEDVDLVTKLGPNLGAVRADPGQLEQVIVNLAVNSRDAMPEGGKLTIETRNAELDQSYASQHLPVQPGRYVMLAVSDTGVGMSEETQSRVFEPFFTTKEKGKGTGLGLATVYGIVKQSDGYVWVYSEVGHGTTLKVYLPRVDAPVQRVAPRAAAKPVRGVETVLLVEDEAALRGLARRVLEAHGYTVLEARTADAALALAREQPGPIHLLLTDVVLPGASGRKLADALLDPRPEVKILFMSGYTEDAIVHRGVLEPDTAFLHKPFSPEALARKVREVLDGG